MTRLILFVVAMTLAIMGTMVFMAGNQEAIMPSNYARVIGTGCFMFSGVVWCLYGFAFRRATKGEAPKHK